MKIAIHKSSILDFSVRWLNYCKEKNIDYKIVDYYADDIIEQVKDCKIVLWHHNHGNPKDVIIAKQILYALETAGKIVFPNFNTGWHFDDKLGQKYLLEALDVPTVKSHAYFSKNKALEWASSTTFPKVFKLRTGAGSRNVKLIKNKQEAKSIINKAFGSGFRQYDAIVGIKESLRKYKLKKTSLKEVLKAFAHLIHPIRLEKTLGRERGYVYFQDFIPNNTYDIRVIVIGDKAFAIKRIVRENDFRASGGGAILYDKKEFDEEVIKIAFDVNEQIQSQTIAYDFIFDENNNPLIIEISFGFLPVAYDSCAGYWDKELNWYEGKFNPYGWMIENLINDY